jgi:hypothetical protein
MRRNVLTAGLVACAVVAICPDTLFGSAPQAALRPAERPDLAPTVVRPWIWEATPYHLTVPLASSWGNPRPSGSCGMGTGDLH